MGCSPAFLLHMNSCARLDEPTDKAATGKHLRQINQKNKTLPRLFIIYIIFIIIITGLYILGQCFVKGGK